MFSLQCNQPDTALIRCFDSGPDGGGSVGISDDHTTTSVCRSGKHFRNKIGLNGTVTLTSKLENKLNCYFWATESGNLPVVKKNYRNLRNLANDTKGYLIDQKIDN